jgi:endonuclease YncB( thermonuclease family)
MARRNPAVRPEGTQSVSELARGLLLVAGLGVPALACGKVPGRPEADLPACVVRRVIDGDTLVCEPGERIRLLLIDAPEMGQGPFGLRARLALEELAPVGATLRLELDAQERDRYGRILAYLHGADGTFINRELVRRGYAVVAVYPPNVRHVELLRAAADSARAERRGLWETSAFECRPADFRAGRCAVDPPPDR